MESRHIMAFAFIKYQSAPNALSGGAVIILEYRESYKIAHLNNILAIISNAL